MEEEKKKANGAKKKKPLFIRRRKKDRKKDAGQNVTFMKLGRGLRRGGATVTRYSKRLFTGFNDFTSGKNDEKISEFVKQRISWAKKVRFSGFVVGSIALLALMLLLLNNTSIRVEEKTISIAGLSSDFEGYRIVLLSDLHGREYGDEQASLLRSLNALKYDLMVLAGDMVGKGGNAQPLYHLLDGKTSSAPVYFIAGDSDPGPLVAEPRDASGVLENYVLEDWILGAIEHGAIYLDAPVLIEKNSSKLWLSPESMLDTEGSPLLSRLNAQYRAESSAYIEGVEAARVALPFTAWRVQCAEKLLSAVNRMESEDLHIAVAHYPPIELYNASSGYSDSGMLRTADLVLAGHYCGGGWKIPFFGALYVPAVEAPRHGWFPDQSLVEGERRLGNVTVYTTGGLSVTDAIALPKFRMNNQPKITVLTLTAALTDDLLGIGG
ncbi:MAG: metallophosphoesterase [Clostridia bacterium]|nr:metallophosphoesterase [Clostridia bacterium]MBO4884193.1 metallophosphoesterase [Clostridia bacterium]